jgi:iron complex transport system ATP-binding protein
MRILPLKTGEEDRGVEAPHTDGFAASLLSVGLDIRGTPILRDISWNVGWGEKWVVLGRNGSGKTSLLRLLSGFGYPSRGTMEVLGGRFGRSDLHQMRRSIGWVNGDLASDFPGFMNCREVVLSGERGSIAMYESMNAQEVRRANESLDAIGAGHLAGRLFPTLSTGERQRVLIARALAAEPRLLLLDEPCIGLDPLAREDFLGSLAVLFRSRPELSVISVTHHVEEIIEGYERILLLADGIVVDRGGREQVLTGPGIRRVYGERCRIARRDGRYAMYFESE